MSRTASMTVLTAIVLGWPSCPGLGDVVTDGSLGAARNLTGPNFAIGADLGRQMGGNLFHSFGRFNLATGESATFSGPASIANIVGRVTGGTPSSIDGTLRSTIAGANLFLLNPAGLLFGSNARLDVSGSFHASTADYLRFADGVRFEARTTNGSSFTAAAPAAFGFLTANPAAIALDRPQLGVPNGQALSFVGGPIAASGGTFLAAAEGGSINLFAAASPGDAILNSGRVTAGSLERFADISFTGSSAFVQNSGPGAITIHAANLTLDAGFVNAFANDASSVPIDVRLTGDLTLTNGAGIGSGQFTATGTGTPGPITIHARNIRIVDSTILSTNFGVERGGDVMLTAADGIDVVKTPVGTLAAVSATTGGDGRAGDVTVRAKHLELTGGTARLTAEAAPEKSGSGGNITIDVERLVLRDGANIASSAVRANGASAGGVQVTASDSVVLTGVRFIDVDGIPLALGSRITTESAGGEAGNLVIETPSLTLQGGSLTSATSLGRGGSILLTVDRLTMTDNGFRGASVSTDVGPNIENIPPRGAAGSVTIIAREAVVVADGPIPPLRGPGSGRVHSSISSENDGPGNPGRVSISTPSLVMSGGTTISTTAFGRGNAGDIEIRAAGGRVFLDSDAAITASSTPLDDSGKPPASGVGGNAGRISISARSLEMRDGTRISSLTSGLGNAGDIAIRVDKISLEGDAGVSTSSLRLDPDQQLVLGGGAGDAGNIAIDAGTVTMRRGGFVASTTRGTGRGGQITVTASETLDIAGIGPGDPDASGVFSRSFGPQSGGRIALSAPNVEIRDGGIVTAASLGSGAAGSISVTADRLRLGNGARVSTEAAAGGGGDIAIVAGQLVHVSRSQVTTSVRGGAGSGGNILIDPQFVVLNDGTIQANAFGGNGGNITIIAGQMLQSPGSVVEASSQLGISGTIVIRAPEADVTSGLTELSSKFFDASTIRREGCAGPVRAERQPSSLIAGGRGGLPQDADSAQPSLYFAGRAPAAPSVARASAGAVERGKAATLRITCG